MGDFVEDITEVVNSRALSEVTRKNYIRIYNKIINELDYNISNTKQEKIIKIIEALSNDNPSNFLTYINIPIVVRKYYNVDTAILSKEQDKYKAKRETHTREYTEKKRDELPSHSVLENHLKQLLKVGNYQDYIINFLLMTFGFRNKDIDLFITTRDKVKNDGEDGVNYLIVGKTECRLIISNYKTLMSHGIKKFTIRSRKFLDAVNKFGIDKYLLSLPSGDHIKESSLASFISNRLYDKLTEGDYFKIKIKDLQGKPNALEEIQKLSLSRGTDLTTIAKHYNIDLAKK